MKTTRQHVMSWGRLTAKEHTVVEPTFLDQAQAALSEQGLVLGFGAGRSYGDVCLNSGGRLLRIRSLDRVISVDWATGILRGEAGLTFDTLLRLAVPRGWFPPVVRSTPARVLKMLPAAAGAVDSVRPMNAFYRPKLDDTASRLPLARLRARMMVVTGRKR